MPVRLSCVDGSGAQARARRSRAQQEEHTTIDTAIGKMPVSTFLRIAALKVVQAVELLAASQRK